MKRRIPIDVLERRILDAWRRTVVAYFDVGDALLTARKALGHGEFIQFVEKRLPFKYLTAYRLCKIAQCSFLRSVSHAKLPADYTTLAELARLEPDEFRRALEFNEISPNMARADAIAVRQRLQEGRPKRTATLAKPKRQLLRSAPSELDLARKRYFALCLELGEADLEFELSMCARNLRPSEANDEPDDIGDVLQYEITDDEE